MRTGFVAVIPAFQCAASIRTVAERCLVHVDQVVVVDDGSTDETAAQARAAGAEVHSWSENRGKGAALRHGLRAALAQRPDAPDALILLDGDGQHDPDDIPALVGAWRRGEGDLIVGTRWSDPSKIPSSRYWTNYIGSRALSWMSGAELVDSQSGFRLLAAALARRLDLRSEGFAIESEMLLKAARDGGRIGHAPVRAIYDEAGGSHFRPLVDTVRISWESVYYKVFDDR
jgi:glycosyltransferase involved in cell wall biosynthesis